ncbi:MAG: alpha/beta hydrolase [Candidatus Komeilibacteria bacterium]|nr:alpha/beta hydrolase [Candidatus Komeilibacteria bacterium]
MEIKNTVIDNLSIRYLEINNNASRHLLFLPGWGGSLETWQEFLTKFIGAPIDVLALDLPGFGQSAKPAAAWDLENYTKFLKNAVDYFKLDHFYLFGHSFGGQVAVNFAYHYPDRLIGLFLSGAAALRPKAPALKRLIILAAKFFKNILPPPIKTMIYRALGSDYGKLDDPIMKRIFQNVIKHDLRHLLKYLRVKTIIIWGRQDNFTPLWQGQLIHGLIGNSQLVVLENIGHSPQLQSPDELYQIISNNL